MSRRIDKVNSLIKTELSEIISQEISFKEGVLITVVKVDTGRDLRYTRVFVSVLPTEDRDYVLATLRKEKKRLQKELHNRLSFKTMPKIIFKIDETEARATEIEKILDSL